MKAAWILFLVMLLAAAAAGASYIVRPGDTLSEIAQAHDTTVRAIADANAISNPDHINIGQTLDIPGATGSDRTHRVVFGEYLSGIASGYGVTVADIVAANQISNPNIIRVGQTLLVPNAGTGVGTAPLVHIVQRGDSLASIAAQHGVSVADLAAANGMTESAPVFVGTQLRISPLPPTFTPDTTGSSVHTVVAGDTLAEIAVQYATTLSVLIDLNDLSNPNRIRIGQQIKVPGGGFVCPVPGSTFFNDWGFPRSGGRFHQGNDLFAARGTPVLAPASGRVDQVHGTIGGLQFWLYGEDGSIYIGTHLDSFGTGGTVSAGTVIGFIGDTGNARGGRPHLHFEIIVNDEAVNPYPHLRSSCG